MAYYRICPECGAYLDPGEKCTCHEELEKKKSEAEKSMSAIKEEINGQLCFIFSGRKRVGHGRER